MLNKKQIVTAGATLGIALTTGFVMQNGDAVASFVAQEHAPQAAVAVPPPVVQSNLLPLPKKPAQAEPEPVEEVIQIAAIEPEVTLASVALDVPQEPLATVETAPVCDVLLRADTIAAAMVRLKLNADCHPNQRVTVHHADLVFTSETDATGMLTVEVPALTEQASFRVKLAGEDAAVAEAIVPTLSSYDRVVLQWRGESALQLHALEFGAEYGGVGHVSAASSRDASAAATGQGGFITRLGSGADETSLTAEVYSFPTRFVTDAGLIDLSVEAEVTALNCARQIEAQAIQIRPETGTKLVDLVLSVPECDAIGDFLVLNSMVEDLTFASR